PTMGALHEGHLSLVDESILNNDVTILSIYVNPLQFDNPKDLQTYPKNLQNDMKLIQSKVDFCFTPDTDTMYPNGYNFCLSESRLSTKLCGNNRQGHFEGVLQIVLKLVNITSCDSLYLGEKDYQQYILLKSLFQEMFVNINVYSCPTKREKDGLALSSRNKKLSIKHRLMAPSFYKVISKFSSYLNSNSISKTEKMIVSHLDAYGFKIEYVSIASSNDLSTPRVKKSYEDLRIFCAVKLGDVRLIDNISYQDSLRVCS
ncbi:pantoate--beta-alanine ligase, partial [bacterium]|nr:pantoate--beta-alanine ligase [bacterium]